MNPFDVLSKISTILSLINGVNTLWKSFDKDDSNKALFNELTKIENDIEELKLDFKALNLQLKDYNLMAQLGYPDARIIDWHQEIVMPWLKGEEVPGGKDGDYVSIKEGTVGKIIYDNASSMLLVLNTALTDHYDEHPLKLSIEKLLLESKSRNDLPTSVCELAYRHMLYFVNIQFKCLLCLKSVNNLSNYADLFLNQYWPEQAKVFKDMAEKYAAQEPSFLWMIPTGNGSKLTIGTNNEGDCVRNITMEGTAYTDGKTLVTGAKIHRGGQTGIAVSFGVLGENLSATNQGISEYVGGHAIDILTPGRDGFRDPIVKWTQKTFEATGNNVITGIRFNEAYNREVPNRGGDMTFGHLITVHADPVQKETWMTIVAQQARVGGDGKLTNSQPLKEDYIGDIGYFYANNIDTSPIGGMIKDEKGNQLKTAGPVNGVAFQDLNDKVALKLKNSLNLNKFGTGCHMAIGQEFHLYSCGAKQYVKNYGQGQVSLLKPNGSLYRILDTYKSVDFSEWNEPHGFRDDHANGNPICFNSKIKLRQRGFRSGDKSPLFLSPALIYDTGKLGGAGMTDFILYDPFQPENNGKVRVGQPFVLAITNIGPNTKHRPVKINSDGTFEPDESMVIDPSKPGLVVEKLVANGNLSYLWEFRFPPM